MNLRDIETGRLVKELINREGVKSTSVKNDEFSKIQIAGSGDKHLRYLKGYGPAIILEIEN